MNDKYRGPIMILTILLWGYFMTTPSFAPTHDPQALLKKIDTYRVPYEKFLITTKITSFEQNRIKETAVFDAYIDGQNKSLVIARTYKTKDMKILYVNENMWVHLPSSRRPIRITPVQRLMGQASNGDVARVSYIADYKAITSEAVRVGETPCFRLTLMAKKPSSTYHKIILYVNKQTCQPLKAQFYLISGKHYKTAVYTDYREFGEKLLLAKMTIFDELKRKQKTTFEYLIIKEKSLPEKYFNKNYLIHIKEL